MDNIIKIVLKQQVVRGTEITFSYPEAYDKTKSDGNSWLRPVGDPRNVIEKIVELGNFSNVEVHDAKNIYAYWKNDNGNYYAIIYPNERDDRSGQCFLVLFTGRSIISSGNALIDQLSKLKAIISNQEEIEEIRSKVDKVAQVLSALLIEDRGRVKMKEDSISAYRTFSSIDELGNYLQYPDQSKYSDYSKILFIHSSLSLKQSLMGIERIESPIKKCYSIDSSLPDGVRVDKDYVKEGDKIYLTYSKSGYLSQPKDFICDGNNNQYIVYNGSTISVNSSEAAGICFKRGIKFDFKCNNKPLSNVKIKYGDKESAYQLNSIYIFDDDKDSYELKVSHNEYEPEGGESLVTLKTEDFLEGKITINFAPKEFDMKVSMLNDDGDKKSGTIKILSNDPLYSIIKKYAAEKRIINKVHKPYEEDNDDANTHVNGTCWIKRWYKPILSCIACLAFFALGTYLGSLYEKKSGTHPVESSYSPKPASDNNPNVQAGTDSGNKDESNSEALFEKEDIVYLKRKDEKDIWDINSIKSQKYRKLLGFISEGNIDAILQGDPWFPEYNDSINGHWLKIISYIKKPNINIDIAEIMRKNSVEGIIDIKKIVSEITSSINSKSMGDETSKKKESNGSGRPRS